MVLEKERANIIKTTTYFLLNNMANNSPEITRKKKLTGDIYMHLHPFPTYAAAACCIASRNKLAVFFPNREQNCLCVGPKEPLCGMPSNPLASRRHGPAVQPRTITLNSD